MQISTTSSVGIGLTKAGSAKSAATTTATTTTGSQNGDAQDLQQALANLKQLNAGADTDSKSDARRKVEQLRQQLKQLKLFCAGDPKRFAKMVAQIAKQLAAANKEYIRAGGTPGLVSASEVSADTDDATTATSDSSQSVQTEDATADAGDAVQAEDATVSDDASMGAGADATSTDSSFSSSSDATASTDSVQTTGASSDDADFFDQVRQLKRQLEDTLKQIKLALKSRHQSSDGDIADARKALDEIDRDLKAAVPSGGQAGAVVDISA
jgi:hypothetical protein